MSSKLSTSGLPRGRALVSNAGVGDRLLRGLAKPGPEQVVDLGLHARAARTPPALQLGSDIGVEGEGGPWHQCIV